MVLVRAAVKKKWRHNSRRPRQKQPGRRLVQVRGAEQPVKFCGALTVSKPNVCCPPMAATRPALARVPYASPRCFVGKASVVTMLSAFHAATETPLKTWMGRREGGNKKKIRIRTIKKAATLLSAELQHARTPLPRGQPQRACLGAPLCPTSQRARWKAPGKRQAKQRQLKGVRGGSSENTTVGNIDRHPSEHPQHTSARRKLSGRKLTQDAIRVPVKSSTMRMPKTLIAERVIETMRVQIEPCRCNRTAGNGGGQLAPNIERSRANWDAGGRPVPATPRAHPFSYARQRAGIKPGCRMDVPRICCRRTTGR